MARSFLWTNFAKSQLAGGIASTDTGLTILTGDGALFPSPDAGQQFGLVLCTEGAPNSPPFEIVYCTSRTGADMAITRGEEGTTPQNWNAGDIVSLRLTAGELGNFLQGFPNPSSNLIKKSGTAGYDIANLGGWGDLGLISGFTFPNTSPTGKFLLLTYISCQFGPYVPNTGDPDFTAGTIAMYGSQTNLSVLDNTNHVQTIIGTTDAALATGGMCFAFYNGAIPGNAGLSFWNQISNAFGISPILYSPGDVIDILGQARIDNTGALPVTTCALGDFKFVALAIPAG